MAADDETPTRVGPVPRVGIRAGVAHGPERDWSKVGEHVKVTITPLGAHVKALRAAGYVFTQIFDQAAEKLLGGDDRVRLTEQLRENEAQHRLLEAAMQQLEARERAAVDAAGRQRAFEDAIRELARSSRDFRSIPRGSNLVWLEARICASPALRGAKPDEVLDLVLAALPPQEGS